MVQNRKENTVFYPKEELADALKGARELMNDSGLHWVQGVSVAPIKRDGRVEYGYCSWGAISTTVPMDWEKKMAVIAELAKDEAIAATTLEPDVVRAPTSPEDEAYNKVVTFNDTPGRTWEEIDAAFRRAEERLRSA